MRYEQSTAISRIAMEDIKYDAVKYAKLSMTRAIVEKIVDSESKRVNIEIDFEEWWQPVPHYAHHEEQEYRINAVAYAKEWN